MKVLNIFKMIIKNVHLYIYIYIYIKYNINIDIIKLKRLMIASYLWSTYIFKNIEHL